MSELNQNDFQKYVLESISKISEEIKSINNRLENIENNQRLIEQKISKIQSSVNGLENDIYEDEYEFEIICPYCNTEFVADVTSKSDIKCPECQNIIELDWNNEDENAFGCAGNCSRCSTKCGDSWFDQFDDINNEDEYDDSDEDDD